MALGDEFEADVEASAVPAPAEPAEPVVSAYAIGIDTRADPTPSATAKAPTNPTYEELAEVADSFIARPGLRYVRTLVSESRRERPEIRDEPIFAIVPPDAIYQE